MQNRRGAQVRPAFILSTLILIMSLPVAAQDITRSEIPLSHSSDALDRAIHESAVKAEKMHRYRQPAMRRNGIDMWIIMSRE